jgi:Tfp pilus assembly protein PilN
LADLRERVAQREALRDLLAADQLPQEPAALLRSVIDALPQTLWLTEVEVARERALRIAGGALDAAALNNFATALAQVPALRGVPVHTVRLEPAAKDSDAPGGWRFVLSSTSATTLAEK